MEASEPQAASPVEAAPAASDPHDVSGVHALLQQAEDLFHRIFSGDHAPSTRSHVERVTPQLANARHIIDLAAAEAAKE